MIQTRNYLVSLNFCANYIIKAPISHCFAESAMHASKVYETMRQYIPPEAIPITSNKAIKNYKYIYLFTLAH